MGDNHTYISTNTPICSACRTNVKGTPSCSPLLVVLKSEMASTCTTNILGCALIGISFYTIVYIYIRNFSIIFLEGGGL